MAEQEKINEYFLSLVFSLSAAAMQQMGKILNPITNKTEKNLEQAKVSIDIIEMLVEKTKGNLSAEENKFLAICSFIKVPLEVRQVLILR